MVTEHALLCIDAARATEFEAAFDEARKVIEAAEGAHGIRLLRGIESPGSYLLLIEWTSVDAHKAFRSSAAFGDWRAPVGPFFVQPPDMEHFELRASHPS